MKGAKVTQTSRFAKGMVDLGDLVQSPRDPQPAGSGSQSRQSLGALSSIRPDSHNLSSAGMSLRTKESGGDADQRSQRLSGSSAGDSGVKDDAPSLDQVFALRLGASENPEELAAAFAREDGITTEEKNLWLLLSWLMEDAALTHDPSVLNLDTVPTTRRWFVSHYSWIQDLLMRSPGLRRLNIVLRWLEYTCDRNNAIIHAKSSTKSELELLLQGVFDRLRCGQFSAAVDAAKRGNCVNLCSLSVARLHDSPDHKSWATKAIPLFGEYSLENTTPNGPGSVTGLQPVPDDSRIGLLCHYNEFAKQPLAQGATGSTSVLLSAIYGTIAGESGAMSRAIGSDGSWQDKLWVATRSRLVHAYFRSYQQAATSKLFLPTASLLQDVSNTVGATGPGWMQSAERHLCEEVIAKIRESLKVVRTETEELQLKVIELFLSLSVGTDPSLFKTKWTPTNSRALSTVLVLLDKLERNNHLSISPQSSEQFRLALENHVSRAVTRFAVDLSPSSIAQFALPLLSRIRDAPIVGSKHRAHGYAALFSAMRLRAKSIKMPLEDIDTLENAVLHHIRSVEKVAHPKSNATDEILDLLSKLPTGEFSIINAHSPTRANTTFEQVAAAYELEEAETAHDLSVTHHPKAEAVDWLSRTEDVTKLPELFENSLVELLSLWDAENHEAVADIVNIVGNRVIKRLPQSDSNTKRFAFWDFIAQNHRLAIKHATTTVELAKLQEDVELKGATGRLTRLRELQRNELDIRQQLLENAKTLLECSRAFPLAPKSNPNASPRGAPPPLPPLTVVKPAAYAIAEYSNACILAMPLLQEGQLSSEGLLPTFRLVTQLEATGRMDDELAPKDAEHLITAIQSLRLRYGEVLHSVAVKKAINSRQPIFPAVGAVPATPRRGGDGREISRTA
jgi:hypothetical protein